MIGYREALELRGWEPRPGGRASSRLRSRPATLLCRFVFVLAAACLVGAPGARAANESYAKAVKAAKPVAYWQFADGPGAGQYIDSSGHGNTLPAGSSSLVSPGVGGKDGALDTTGGGTSTTSPLSPLVGDASRTLEAWVRTTAGGCVLTAGSSGPGQAFSMCFADGPYNSPAPGAPGFYLQTWGADIFIPYSGWDNGAWHYVAVTLSGSNVNVILDGTQPSGYVWDGSNYGPLGGQPFALPSAPNTASSPLGIGTSGWTSGLAGGIDEVAVYPTALPPAQLVDHYMLAGASASWPAAYGVIFTAKPGASDPLISYFNVQHQETWTEPQDCYQADKGCNVDGLRATVDWGDGSSPAPVRSIKCVLPPPPGPSPTPVTLTMRCTVDAGAHTYAKARAYRAPILIEGKDGQQPVREDLLNEAQISPYPTSTRQQQSVGVLVATDPNTGEFYPCTATVLISVGGSEAIAAAHCVASLQDGHLYNQIAFAPLHSGPVCASLSCGTNPLGVFHASSTDVVIHPNVQNEQRYDWSFIHFAPVNGKTLEQTVGGLGMALGFHPNYDQLWQIWGYPHGQPVPGQPGQYNSTRRTCSGQGSVANNGGLPGPPGPPDIFTTGSGCTAMTEGASGGPWVNTSNGEIGAVNKAVGGGGVAGTYLDNTAKFAFLRATLGSG